MTTSPSLVVLAAGLGSRYGSLKQIDSFGPSGETIVDYSIYDAIKAGFKKIVFVIRKDIEEEFIEVFYKKLSGLIEVHYVFQELDALPNGFVLPEGRTKPWGTAHAVLMAENVIHEPFAIVNADDYYGRESLKLIYDFLNQKDMDELQACLVGYRLSATLSDHGKVARGICEVNGEGMLQNITERTGIYKNGDARAYYVEDNEKIPLPIDAIVSMNLMGFTPKVFSIIRAGFEHFLHQAKDDLKKEYFIPDVLNALIKRGIQVPVLTTHDSWFGVTYKEDKPVARDRLKDLIERGYYPKQLWE